MSAWATRDYDSLIAERPTTAPVQRSSDGALRTVTTQLRDWRDESPVYDVTHLQLHEVRPQQWAATSRTMTYRAWLRPELAALATEAGLRNVRWVQPHASGFFQPIMLARACPLTGQRAAGAGERGTTSTPAAPLDERAHAGPLRIRSHRADGT